MTGGELAKRVGVSESTIIRFAYALGFDGFPALRMQIQEALKSRVDTIHRTALSEAGDSPIITRAMQADVDNIIAAQKANPIAVLQEAMTSILQSRRVALLGFRSARAILYYAMYNLTWILPKTEVFLVQQDNLYEQLMRLEEGDTVIAISLNRYPRATVEGLRFANERGPTCIALTDSHSSPLAESADIVLLCPASLMGFVDSFVTPLSIIRSLLLMIVSNNKESQEALAKLESMWESIAIYEQ